MERRIDHIGVILARYISSRGGGFKVTLMTINHERVSWSRSPIHFKDKAELRGFLSGLGQMIHDKEDVFFLSEASSTALTFHNKIQARRFLGPKWVEDRLALEHLRSW